MTEIHSSDHHWIKLFRIGGVSALLCAFLYILTLGVYIPANLNSPPPENVTEWLQLLQSSPLTGLFYLGLSDVFIMLFWVPMVLALYILINKYHKTWMTIAGLFVIVGVAVYIATNTSFSMLSLSHRYQAAASEAEKTAVLAAGQSLIALTEGTGRYAGMPLVWLSGMTISIIMLRSSEFKRATAWTGILGLGLLVLSVPFAGYTTTGTSSAAVKTIIFLTYSGGGILSLIWYIMVGTALITSRGRSVAGEP